MAVCLSFKCFFKVMSGKELFMYFQAEDAERREKNLEEAKKIVIEEDKSLPAPKQVGK